MKNSSCHASLIFWGLTSMLVTMVLAGCGVMPASGDSSQSSVTLAATGASDMLPSAYTGDLVEVQLKVETVQLDSLFNLTLVGDFIFATTKQDGQVDWLAVQLPTGYIYGSNNTRHFDQAITAPQRYSLRSRWGNAGMLDQLFVYDWNENQETEFMSGHFGQPAQDGTRVVLVQHRGNGMGSIWVYEIETKTGLQIASDQDPSYNFDNPRISGDWVGYTGRSMTQTTKADLYAHNLVTSETLRLTTVPYFQSAEWKPYALGDNIMAWIERDSDTDVNAVHVYNLNTRQNLIVNDLQPGCMVTDVEADGALVSWSCAGHRYGFDMARKAKFELPLAPPGVKIETYYATLFSENWLVWIARTSPGEPFRLFVVPII